MINRLPTGLLQTGPQVLCLCVPVRVFGEIGMHSFAEHIISDEVMQHANDRGSLGVGDGVEYLFYLTGVLYWDLWGVSVRGRDNWN